MRHSEFNVRRGFSLAELMVSMAVLSVLMVVLVQAIGAVSKTWKTGAAQIDNLVQARAVLAMIDRDVQAMVIRRDVAAFRDADGHPACAFYSMVPGGNGERRLSLVSYAIDDAALGLRRADYELDYDSRVLTLNETEMLPDLKKPEVVTDTFAAGAVSFKCQFMKGDGKFQDHFHFDFDKPDAITNTRCMVLSLLMLDNAAFSIAQDVNAMPELIARFSSESQADRSYAQVWKDEMDGLPGSLPEPVRAGLRLFERRYTLPCP